MVLPEVISYLFLHTTVIALSRKEITIKRITKESRPILLIEGQILPNENDSRR